MRPRHAIFLAGLTAAALRAGGPNPAPAGGPRTIRIWGNDQMATLVARWEAAFARRQPAVRFETKLLGTGTGMAGLYAGGADIAFMGRDATPKEIQAFQWVFRHPPQRIDVVVGGRDRPGKSPALVVFVPRDNPLAHLTLAQLAAIVGCEPPDGRAPIRTWGQLGLTGVWTDRPIHVYTFDTETGTGLFLQHVLLHDSRKWAWNRVTEFQDGPDGGESAGTRIVAALAADRDGLGVATACDATPAVRPVGLAAGDAGPFLTATPENLADGSYPLARVLPAYVDRLPGHPLDPTVREFLAFILDPQGQEEVTQDGGYLPLSPAAARKARAQLN